MKCIDVKSNAFRVPLMIWIIAVLVLVAVHPVKAETGNITITSNPTIASYEVPNQQCCSNPDFTKIKFDNTDYNQLFEIIVKKPSWGNTINFASDFKSTTFTITAGGSGTGTAWFDKNSSSLYWVFNSDFHATGNLLTLSYATNIWADITTGGSMNNAVSPGVTTPAYIASLDGNTEGFSYPNTQVKAIETDSYNIVYNSTVAGTLFNITITKQGFVATKYFIHSQTGGYTQESSFNKNSFSFMGLYGSGLYANGTFTGGQYQDVLINSSGVSVAPTPTPTPGGVFNPPLTIPSGGASIQFNQTKYVVGDTARVEWAISNADWNGIGQTFIIDFIQNGNAFLSDQFPTGQIPVSSQTGNYSFAVFQPSVIQATLYGGFLVATNNLSTAYTTFIPATPAYLIAPQSAQQGQSVYLNYSFGSGNTVNPGYVVDAVLDDFGQPIQSTVRYINLSCPCSVGSITTSFVGTGKHKLALFDGGNFKTVASTTILITGSDVLPILNLTTNSLTTDNSVYNYNDVVLGSYAISTTNFSAYPYFAVEIRSAAGILINQLTITSQTGNFNLPINSGVFQTLQSGAGFVNLTARSSAFNTTSILLASVPVTINANANGYSVSASQQTICSNTDLFVKYTAPSGIGILNVSYVTPAGNTKTNTYPFSSNGTKTLSFSAASITDKSGITLDIYDTSGNFQVGEIVKFTNSGTCAITPTLTPTVTGMSPGQATNAADALTSTVFLSLIFTAGLMAAIAWKTNSMLPTSIIGMASLGVFTYITWFPAWIFFSIIVVASILLAKEIVEAQTKNVTR